jgi:SAM-dependent methyltransferase
MAEPDVSPRSAGAAQAAYLSTRFTPDPRREAVWRHVAQYLSSHWRPGAAIADIGAGYCSFINQAPGAGRRIAVDIHDELERHATAGVECVQASATDLPLADASLDVVFASNLLEHLSREDIAVALDEFRRVLRPSGRLLLVQPNYRLCSREYFDDYTHLTPLSDRSLSDLLGARGFDVLEVQARFLPLTLKGSGGNFSFLVPWYLRSPLRPLAGQMLLVATPGTPVA